MLSGASSARGLFECCLPVPGPFLFQPGSNHSIKPIQDLSLRVTVLLGFEIGVYTDVTQLQWFQNLYSALLSHQNNLHTSPTQFI